MYFDYFKLRNLLYFIIDISLFCGRKEKSSDKTNCDFILIIDVILYLIKINKIINKIIIYKIKVILYYNNHILFLLNYHLIFSFLFI